MRKPHRASQQHKQNFCRGSRRSAVWISPPQDWFSSFLTCHTLIPTSHIHDLSHLPVRYYYSHARVSSCSRLRSHPGHSACASAITVILSACNKNHFPTGLPQGCGQVLRSPCETHRLHSAQPQDCCDQALGQSVELLKGPGPCNKPKKKKKGPLLSP